MVLVNLLGLYIILDRGHVLQTVGTIIPYNADICWYKPWKLKVFLQFEIIINVLLVSSFHFIWIPMLYAYGH